MRVKDKTPAEKLSVRKNYESEKESNDEHVNYLRSNQDTFELTHTVDIGASSPKSKSNHYFLRLYYVCMFVCFTSEKKPIRKSRGVTVKTPSARRNRKHTSPSHPFVGDNVVSDVLLHDSPKIEIVKDLPASEKSTAEGNNETLSSSNAWFVNFNVCAMLLVKRPVKDETPAENSSVGKNPESEEGSNDEPLEYLPSSQKTTELANKEGVDAASPTSKSNSFIL